MDFIYQSERFADLQLLRYRLDGFEKLSLRQKIFIFYLAKATLFGRDITFDQNGKYNLLIRKTLEAIYTYADISHDTDEWRAFEVYLKRVWFSNGVYHHYGCEKFEPGFSEQFLRDALKKVDAGRLPADADKIWPAIFDAAFMPKRVNKADGEDLVLTSACNFYDGVTQHEAEDFYARLKERDAESKDPPSYGLNSTLVKEDGIIKESVWCADGLYGPAIRKIIYWLDKAKDYAENEHQKLLIEILINYYQTGDLSLFNKYSIEWVSEHDATIDFINGFIEVYGDPLGMKATWEGLVEYIDEEATHRTQSISNCHRTYPHY